MVKLKSKKVVAFLGAILLLVAVGIATYLFFSKHSKSTNTDKTTTQEDVNKKNAEIYAQGLAALEKSRQDGITSNIKDTQIKTMYNNLNAKNYTAVVQAGATLCKQALGNDQFYCYDFYGQALAAQNDLAMYITIGNEALQSAGVKSNTIAVQAWNTHLAYAKKGQNPYVITPEMDEEARR